LIFFGCQSQTASDQWISTPAPNTSGKLFTHKNISESTLRILTEAELKEEGSDDLNLDLKSASITQLEDILSILWVDVNESSNLNASTKNPAIIGTGEGENGSIDFAITYKTYEGNKVVALVTTPLNVLEKNGGIQLLEVLPNKGINKQPQPIATQKSPAKLADYPLPTGKKNAAGKMHWTGWTYSDDAHAVARKNDPAAPRMAMEIIKNSSGNYYKQAIQEALRINQVKGPSYLSLEPVEVGKTMVGTDMYITMGHSMRGGHKAVLFIRVYKQKNKSDYNVLLMEIPEATYNQWGGIASILLATQVIKSLDGIPKDRMNQIANASPKQQIAFYEASYTSVMTALYQGIMMTQSQTLLQMQELNYDLLFGNDITDPGIGN